MQNTTEELGYDLLVSHPVVSDPTDFKGLPYAKDNIADFLPFGDLRMLMECQKPLVWFIDDLGQAPASVQAAIMQILLARKINGHAICDNVSIVAATNRKQDKAGVNGMLEPVKSRFVSIVELNVSLNDWKNWAIENNMPAELVSFINFKPDLIEKFEATKDITNSPSPRTIAHVGKMQNAGLIKELELEAITGAIGQAAAIEYVAFLELFRQIPDIDDLITSPMDFPLFTNPSINYGLSGALAYRINKDNIENICKYLERIPSEYSVAAIQMGIQKNPTITNTKAFIVWSVNNQTLLGIK